MDAIQMQYNFDNMCRNHEKLHGLDVATDDVELYLNHAQNLVTDKYIETFNKEESSRIYLQKLIKARRYLANEGFTNTTNAPNGTYFTLPTDLKYVIPELEEATITLDTIQYRARIKPIIGKHYNLNNDNPFKKSYYDMCWRLHYGVDNVGNAARVHQIIVPTGATLVYYYINYVKYPIAINLTTNNTSELDESVHNEIVITAMELFLKSVQNKISLSQLNQN